ncbi:MAG TPA: hypothetical protein VFF15_01160 [Flavobacteriaceae bacterium]|nr:hypothetical protein [Flavobacteriaceae bacterium]
MPGTAKDALDKPLKPEKKMKTRRLQRLYTALSKPLGAKPQVALPHQETYENGVWSGSTYYTR